MSSFVVSDYTVLAIVEGMRKYGLINKRKRESADMAEAIRLVNEYMVCKRCRKTDTDKWITEISHTPVEAMPREFADGEIMKACDCWIYQVDTGEPMDLDFLTIFESVKKLRKTIIDQCKQNGTLQVRCCFGNYHYFFYDEEIGAYCDNDERYDWDLEERPRAA